MSVVEIVAAGLAVLPVLFFLACFKIPALKRWMAGYSKYSRCWLGQHRWSMPGGCCERCGLCDRFFGGHEDCGKTCRHFEAEHDPA